MTARGSLITAVRALMAFIVFVAAHGFIMLVPLNLIGAHAISVLPLLVSLLCAGLLARATRRWSATAPDGTLASMLYGALLLGGTGSVLGFFGPMIFAPEANQGPLLGIFITGPLGFVLGGAAGLVRSVVRSRAIALPES
jgi:hypothetical protein